MMKSPKRIVVFQTAFLGDVILTLPLIQILSRNYPLCEIDVVTTPLSAGLLKNHPAVSTVLAFDKRGTQKGISGILRMARFLRNRHYDVAIVPHRSMRTAAIIALSHIPDRITFSTSAGAYFFNHIVEYVKSKHEVERNFALLTPLGISIPQREVPSLYPSLDDINTVNKFLFEREILHQDKMIAIAPGSVWNTKRWILERFTELAVLLAEDGYEIIVVGGQEDSELGKAMYETGKHKNIYDATGKLSLLQSAELIGRCKILVSNDSAPQHLGVAMRTPVIALFGPTVPAFGFAPYGNENAVIETLGLECRPCSIHGGDRCPIGTFDCMKKIETEMVYAKVEEMVKARKINIH